MLLKVINNLIVSSIDHKSSIIDIEYAEKHNGFIFVDNNEVPNNFYNLTNVKYINGDFDFSEAIEINSNHTPVPEQVTRRQAKQQILLSGLLDSVNDALSTIVDPVQKQLLMIYWEDSLYFERNHPMTIGLAIDTLGMTEDQLDELFRAASQL